MAPKKDSAAAEGAAEGKEEPKEEVKKAEEEPKDAEAKEEAEPEKPKELEEDAPADSRKKLAPGTACMSEADCTLNVMPTAGGSVLMCLGEGGFQYLLASARSTVGLKGGRYMFEARIVENLTPESGGKAPGAKQVVRIGFSLAGSSLFLADTEDSICFDSEGFFQHGKQRVKCGTTRVDRGTYGVLLNLDQKSANANTVSLFKNGTRVGSPQAIPENFKGKALYPTITYRNATVSVNFGPSPSAPLPFTCRMISDAAADDVEVSKVVEPKDGKYEVVYPVALPDQGLFDWVDDFIAKNPNYTELSERKIIEWAAKSGITRPKGHHIRGCNDKPEAGFGIPSLDDGSVRRVLSGVAPLLKRNYVVAEVKANLMAAERNRSLAQFSSPKWSKVAKVIIGKPDKAYSARVLQAILADKKAKAESEKKKKQAEVTRKRLLAERAKKAEEAKRARMAAQKKKAGDESVAEEKEEEEKPVEEEKMDDVEDVVVELTEEEKATVHRKLPLPDLTEKVLAKTCSKFAMPTKEEGFKDIQFVWEGADKCEERLREFVLELKRTSKAEDLQPSAWFKEKWAECQKLLQEWRKKHNDWKDPNRKKGLLERKKAALKKQAEEAAGEGNKAEEVKIPEVDAEELDVLAVEDVTDIGSGEPLFANFVYEDWTLLSTRLELHLLLHAFKKDLNDPDRVSFPENHLDFYYTKYFKKSFSPKTFGKQKVADVIELIRDSVALGDRGFLSALLDEDTPAAKFVNLAEEHRRDRQRRVDAGDETALLKFSKPSPPPPKHQGGQYHRGGQQQQQARPPPRYQGRQAPPPPQPRSGGGGGGYASQRRPYTPSYSTEQPAWKRQRPTGGSGYYRR